MTNQNTDKLCDCYCVDDVKNHNTDNDCWIIYRNGVYDVTSFLKEHPGGTSYILERAGTDITNSFYDDNTHQHTRNALNILKRYKLGSLIGSEFDEDVELTDEKLLGGYKEELIDWNRGLVLQVHKLGADYWKWVNSPVNKQCKLFDSATLEFFINTPWYMVPIIWLPVVLYFAIVSIVEIHESIGFWPQPNSEAFQKATSLLAFSFSFLLGVLPAWTFMEYTLHRFLFHLEPQGDRPLMITFHFLLHGNHHKTPFDTKRLVFPPLGVAILAFFFYNTVHALPVGYGRAVFSGGLLGYVIYDVLHHYYHTGSPQRGSYLHSMKSYHVLHHFEDHQKGFGLTSKFWDFPFSTVNKRAKVTDKQRC